MAMLTEVEIPEDAAIETMKLINEHLTQAGPFNDDLLLQVLTALGEADRIVIRKFTNGKVSQDQAVEYRQDGEDREETPQQAS